MQNIILRMSHLAFDLIAWPNTKKVYPLIHGKGVDGLLLVMVSSANEYAEDAAYVQKIIDAVGLKPMATKIFALHLEQEIPFSLASLAREKQITKIILFGYPPAAAGIRAQWPAYTWTKIAGLQVLQVDSLQQIRTERAAGNSQKAKALWEALQPLNI